VLQFLVDAGIWVAIVGVPIVIVVGVPIAVLILVIRFWRRRARRRAVAD